ncbi:MAG: hypothetical protein II920_10590, partial [Clostridia bacterium]|nr:hypothetical protein [Clostridia bacterium]
YTKGHPLKEKIQVYGLAAVFLVLLYRSPSGLVLYWLLNNRVLPFLPADRIASPEETSKAFERRISGEALPVPASGDCGELLQVIRKATDYNPDKRYADAAEMKAALLAACGKSPVAHKAKRKKRLLIIAALCALVIALAGVAYGLFLRPEPLPKNLNLPLHMDKDYINVVFLYPTQLTDDHSIALTLAQFDTAIEENWERWGVRDDTDIRNDLQRIINKDFYAMQAGVRVELVAYFPIEGEDYSEITKTYTSLGMPLFAFSSSDDDVIYSEWTELMEWVCR